MSEDGSDDPFRPPDIPVEVHCIHCGEEYESYLIKWVPDETARGRGFWCCPTPGCDGIGFCFDIWPTDPEWRDENGEKVMFFDDEEFDDEEYDESAFDEEEFDEEDEEQWSLPDERGHNGDEPDDPTFGEDDIPF